MLDEVRGLRSRSRLRRRRLRAVREMVGDGAQRDDRERHARGFENSHGRTYSENTNSMPPHDV